MSTAVSVEPRRASPPAALAALPRVAAPPRTRWWIEVLAIGWLLWIYDAITNLAPLRLHVALAHAASVLNLERALHLDPELGLDHWLAARHALGLAISDYYDNAHFIVTLGILGWLWWSRSDYYRPLRNALVLVNLIAFAIFWRFPVAPPRMLPGFTDVVSSTGAIGSWHSGALASHANELAAMPSLHMAWAGWCAVALWAVSRRWWVRALGVAHLLLTAFAVISTGNHFLLDVIAGLAVLGVSLAAVSGLGALTARRSAPAPAASP